MNPDTLIYWLTLYRLKGLGSARLAVLLEAFGSPEHIFAASRSQLQASLADRSDIIDAICAGPDPVALERELDWLAGADNHIITLTDPDYPTLLRELSDPPPVLFVRGDRTLLAAPQLAVVGSRNPTPAGREHARAFAQALADAGLVVTSGLALGIDGAAHEGTLEAGGRTLAVAGTGLARVYPARHRELAHRIVKQGALVSEFPLDAPPMRENFPRRNRIISGLTLGTLVVEAAQRSGSLITARLAAEQGREVFAIPGSIHSPLSRGCHALIRQGAKLVETAQDILEELGPLAQAVRQASLQPLINETEIRARVSQHPSTADTDLLAGTGRTPSSRFDVVSTTPSPSSGPRTPSQRHLDALATNGGEKCGLDVQSAQLFEQLGYDPVDIDTLVERSGLTPDAISSMLLKMELQGLVESCIGGKYQRTHA